MAANARVASLYAEIGLKISQAMRGLREFRSRLVQAQIGLKTLRDQARITATNLSIGITAPLGLLGKVAVSALADAGKSMNVFQLVTKATAAEMELARATVADLAKDMSLPKATTQATAAALAELGKAGLSAKDAIAGLRPTMLLAAAGEIAASDAAQILANTLNAFKLPGTEAARIADLLAGAEVAAAGSIRDHALALSQSMAVWAQAKIPVEDLVTSIALLANAGIIGSDAGTSLRTMMLRLIAPSEEAAGMMRAMGISIYDAQGSMRPFRDIIKDFERGLAPLTEAQRNQRLEMIFGTDAIRAAVTVFGGGIAKYDEMKTVVTQTGLAQELATAKTAGLAGAVDNIGKSLNEAAMSGVRPFEADIQNLARGLSEALAWFNNLDDGTKRTIITVGVVAGLLGPLAFGINVVAGAAGTLAAALAFLAANPVVAIIGALILLGGWLVYLYHTNEWFRTGVDAVFGDIKNIVSNMWTAVGSIFGFFGEWLVYLWGQGGQFGSKIGDAFRSITEAVQTMWGVVRPILEPFLDLLGRIGTALEGAGRALGLLPPPQLPANPLAGIGQPPIAAGPAPAPEPTPRPGETVTAGPDDRGRYAYQRQDEHGVSMEWRREGGPVMAGRSYIVGEERPELFVPNRSGTILPSTGGDVNVNFYAPVYGLGDFESEVVRAIDIAKRRGRA